MKTRPVRRPAAVGLAALLLLASACSRAAKDASDPVARPSNLVLPPAQRAKIHVETLTPTALTRTVEATGTVAFDADRATAVLAPMSGPVTRLLAPLGASVVAGQALADVASPDFAAAVSGYRKALATATNARRVADLDKALFANGGIARRDMEQAATDAVAAEADRDASLAQLRALGIDERTLADIREGRSAPSSEGAIRAPIAGTLVERLITPGQLLQAGTTPCFTIADLSTVWVMASVFESDVALVATGDPVEIAAGGADEALPGRVDTIADLVDPVTRAVAVRIVAANPRRTLKKDQYVRVAIHSQGASRGLLVPASAVLRDSENLPFVYVETDDGSFARRRVELGMQTGDRLEVTSGLQAGARVVTEGGLFMQFAQSQ